MKQQCDKPPQGWWCSREFGHDGPCAARPIKLEDSEGYKIPSQILAEIAEKKSDKPA